MSDTKFTALVGTYLGRLLTLGEDGSTVWVTAVRQGYDIVQVGTALAPVLDRHSVPQPISEPDRQSLQPLIERGVLLEIGQDAAGLPPAARVRLVSAGDSQGLDEDTALFRLRGASGRVRLVTEPVYWAWVYASTCATAEQLARLVATLVPGSTPEDVSSALRSELPQLLLDGCVTLDSPLTAE